MERPKRCTGSAISVAVAILECVKNIRPARIITLVGGTCTYGPGQVASESLKIAIRSHHDIQKNKNEKCQFMDPAIKYFEAISKRAIA